LSPTPLLEVDSLVVRYGPAIALNGVSLHVAESEAVAVIGANGAGKSTLVNTLSGLVKPASGRIRVNGRFVQVPEGRQVFPDMSVEDNLKLGAWGRKRRDPSKIYDLLPELTPFRRRKAGNLSGGQQQMVAIGRALMAEPNILAVDELSLGLAPVVVKKLASFLEELQRVQHIGLLLIEQNARLALSLCDRGYILESGQVVAEGPASQLANDPALEQAYLGNVEKSPMNLEAGPSPLGATASPQANARHGDSQGDGQ
jgi:branched-chain amino acid transport system ATP-binding protein